VADILAVGAHPDDVEIAAGATLLKMRAAGHSLFICCATNGEPTPRGSVETRLAEARASAQLLGAELRILDLRNRYLLDTLENRRAIASVIREVRPKLLLCPYPGGDHPDHRAVSALADAARFYGKLTSADFDGRPWPGEPYWVPRQYYYLNLGVQFERVEPSFIVDCSDFAAGKRQLLACYASQFGGDLIDRALQDHWGIKIGASYGEAFWSRHAIGVGNFFDLTH
jgi:LmbE family N-acetylglucosaminyl deacetylase